MMLRTSPNKPRRSTNGSHRETLRGIRGFTLIELMIAVTITAALALTVGYAITTASSALNRQVDLAANTQAALRMARLVKYDVSSARDVFVFNETPTAGAADTNVLCSSWRSQSRPLNWTDPNFDGFVLPLFTVLVQDVDYSADDATAVNSWLGNAQKPLRWLGYEVRRELIAGAPQYSIWRVQCGDDVVGGLHRATWSAGSSTPERLFVIGPQLTLLRGGATVSVRGGTDVLRCDARRCPVASTTLSVRLYQFVPPYSGDLLGNVRKAARLLSDSRLGLGDLHRRVDFNCRPEESTVTWNSLEDCVDV